MRRLIILFYLKSQHFLFKNSYILFGEELEGVA